MKHEKRYLTKEKSSLEVLPSYCKHAYKFTHKSSLKFSDCFVSLECEVVPPVIFERISCR